MSYDPLKNIMKKGLSNFVLLSLFMFDLILQSILFLFSFGTIKGKILRQSINIKQGIDLAVTSKFMIILVGGRK